MAKAPVNVPLQTANRAELIAQCQRLAGGIQSINAGVTMQVTAASTYTGLIQQYHQINGFILAEKPDRVRVIGQLPVVGTNIFDMVSDGKTFSMYVPSKNQFLTGPATLEKRSEKPVENLRPQHLMDAIFWHPIPDNAPVLFEQASDNGTSSYILTVVNAGSGPADWKIARKIWFERAGLALSRVQAYAENGTVESDVKYAQWAAFGDVQYPKQITLDRPVEGYTIVIGVTKLTANAPIEASRFVLSQPAGTQLVRVGDSAEGGAN